MNFVINWNEKALDSHVFPIPIPPATSLPTHSLQVLPEHQVRALVSCIQPGRVICFTLDSIHVSMLFSWNIPPSPSPTESERLFYKDHLGTTINTSKLTPNKTFWNTSAFQVTHSKSICCFDHIFKIEEYESSGSYSNG